MELVERDKEAGNWAERGAVPSLVPASLDPLLDVTLDSSALLKPPSPTPSSQQFGTSALAKVPLLPTTDSDRPILLDKAKIGDKPCASSEPQSEFEVQISALLEDSHAQEEDSDSVDIPLYQPSSKAAETPTFSERKRTDFRSVEAEKDYFALKTTNQSKDSVMKSSVCEEPQEFFSFASKSEERAGNPKAEFSFTATKEAFQSQSQPDKPQIDQPDSPAQSSTRVPELKLTHLPDSTSPLVDQMVRAVRPAPPSFPSKTRSVKRQRFIKKREERPTGELHESGEEVKTGQVPIRPSRKVKLKERREVVDLASQIDGNSSAARMIQENPSFAQDPAQKPFILQETYIEEAPFRPVSSFTPDTDQPVLPASPAVRSRPKPVSRELPDAISGRSGSPALGANPLLKTHSDNEGDDDFSICTPGNVLSKVSSLKPFQGQSAAFEGERIREEGANPEEDIQELRVEDKTAEAQVEEKAEAWERKREVKWSQEEDKKQDLDTSFSPMLDSGPPARAPAYFSEPSAPRAQPRPQAFRPEERPRPTQELPITHNELWPLFEHIDIQNYLESVDAPTPQKVSCFSRCFRAAPIELEGRLKDQIGRIYALTHIELDDSALHTQLLENVWRFLVRSMRDYKRHGKHWEMVGFQGTDPGKELGNVGVFGLLQLLFLACNMPDDAEAILIYSRKPITSFPFAAISLHLSEVAVKTLRTGKLDKEIEKRGEAYRTVRTR